MLLSSRIPLPRLIDLCHVLRHNLDAGLTLVRVFEQQSLRGSEAVRPLATRVAVQLKRGQSLEAALADEKDLLPPLFLTLVAIGEQTGNLPEVLESLESFYRTQSEAAPRANFAECNAGVAAAGRHLRDCRADLRTRPDCRKQ